MPSIQEAAPSAAIRPASASRAKAWSMTSVLMLLYLVNYGDKVVLGIAAQPLMKDLGLTASQLGMVGSVFFLAMTLGGFLAGPAVRLMSMKWLLAVLAIVWAACMVPIILSASFAVLLISRLLLGLFEGPSSALIHTAVYSWHPVEKRALPGALITSAAALSKIVLAPILTYLVVNYTWRSAFAAMCAASFVWLLIWLFTWTPGPYGSQRKSRAEGSIAPGTSVRWSAIFRTPTFLGALAGAFAFYALLSVVLTWLPSFFEVSLGFSRLEAGTLFGVPSIVALFALFATSFFGDRLMSKGGSSRIHRGIVPAAGLLICGLGMVSLPWIVGTPWLVVAIVSIGYGAGTVVFPLFNAAISEICPAEQLAGTLGVFLAVMNSGGILGPYLAGLIVDTASSPAAGYTLTFQVLGCIVLVGAVIALLTVNPARDATRIAAALDIAPKGKV